MRRPGRCEYQQRVVAPRKACGKHRQIVRIEDAPTPHFRGLLQILHEALLVKMKVREKDATASVDKREPGRPSRVVVFHESGM